MMRHAFLFVAALAGAVAACDDQPTDSSPRLIELEARYVLDSVDGVALPASLTWDLAGYRIGPYTVVADTLEIEGMFGFFFINRSSTSDTIDVPGVFGSYDRRNDSLFLITNAEPYLQHPFTAFAVIDEGRLVVESAINFESIPFPGRRLVYRALK